MRSRTDVEPIVHTLAGEIGERFGGSAADAKAANAIAEAFRELGLQVNVQDYSFIGWRPGTSPWLRLLDPASELETAPMLYTASTPPTGLTGRLERYGHVILIPDVFEPETFVLRDTGGRDAALIYVKQGGRAIPLQNARPMYRLPQVVIGEEDGRSLGELVASTKPVMAELGVAGELVPDAVSHNIVGSLRVNAGPRRIVVGAHYDTTIGTPGAYDNASGVGGLVALARRLLAKPIDRNVDFVAFGCEESGFWGSNHYVNLLKDQHRLHEVEAVVNLDQIAAGDFLWIWAGPDAFTELVVDALAAERAFDQYQVRIDSPKPGADDFPFAKEGIPTVSFIFWVPPYYHTAEDTLDRLDSGKSNLCVASAERVLRSLDTQVS